MDIPLTSKPAEFPNFALVDPFIGNAERELPEPIGIAASWWCAKPPIGNTHPGACLPFGMVSACSYSGAYVTGYGRYAVSLSGDSPPILFEKKEILGISHFQQSGTGRIRVYYNYFLTTPIGENGLAARGERHELLNERAWPGFYSGTFGSSDIHFEIVATHHGIRHRYLFPANQVPHVAIDVSAGGLLIDEMKSYPQWAELSITDDGIVCGEVVMEGIPIKFSCVCRDATAYLWEDDELLEAGDYTLNIERQKYRPQFGFGFRSHAESAELQLSFGFSLQELSRAESHAKLTTSFGDSVYRAASIWEETLSKIEVRSDNEEQKRIFQTALYHSCLKPADFSNENPFSKSTGPFFFDLVLCGTPTKRSYLCCSLYGQKWAQTL